MANRLHSISSYRANEHSIQCEFSENQHIVYTKLWLFQKQIHWKCSCRNKSENGLCPHLWTAFLLADESEDFANGKKRGITLAMTDQPQSIPSDTKDTESSDYPTTTIPETQQWPTNQSEIVPVSPTDITFILTLDSPHPVEGNFMAKIFWATKTDQQKWSQPKPLSVNNLDTTILSDDFCSFALPLLRSCALEPTRENPEIHRLKIPETIANVLFPYFGRRKRLYLAGQKKALQFLEQSFELHLDFTEFEQRLIMALSLSSNDFAIPFEELRWLGPSGVFLTETQIGNAEIFGSHKLIQSFIHQPTSPKSIASAELFVQRMLTESTFPKQLLPTTLKYADCEVQPTGTLYFRPAKFKFRGAEWLHADLSFNYEQISIPETNETQVLIDRQHRRNMPRQWLAETRLREHLLAEHFRYAEKSYNEEIGWKLAPRHLDEVVKKLLPLGWQIIAEGKTYRLPTDKSVSMKSAPGSDWFDIDGGAFYNGEFIPLPRLLEAMQKQQNYVILGDGSFGVLPIEWLMNYTVLSEFTITEGDLLRFKKSQIHLLNALLDKMEINYDQEMQLLRDNVQKEQHFSPHPEPQGFCGELRPYQKIGLGWLLFLQTYGFGGCLADDMGLGKTVQILALLQHYYNQMSPTTALPTLLILPRSLMFNWQKEAERFTPNLTLHLHVGPQRMQQLVEMKKANLVLTTYGTIRRDAGALRHFRFAYCILDEAQAIKNRNSAISKATRLIRAEHRLAITGTPIENSLEDLLSLFHFLNPSLLHYSSLFKRLTSECSQQLNEQEANDLRRLISPLILRRTKKLVAPELPDKIEDVIYCEMSPEQETHYQQLRAYYRQKLLEEKEAILPGSSQRIETLSALLRLRQAACHLGLLNPNYHASPSGKTEILLSKIEELVAEGHKILVFSQFVTFLQLIKEQLENAQIDFCYLDGQTQDRQNEVETFQNNPEKKVFLISLKAGGVGLNLTAADYVFLTDPWWNPAIENQAIDRAFRIGQTRRVVAYRLITHNSIEEKIMLLQQRKQQIAGALIQESSLNPNEIFNKETLAELL